jgi:fructose-1,6-bisphosphatase I
MNIPVVSLTRYLLDHERDKPELGAEFCHLMIQLAFAAKIMAHDIALAPLVVKPGLAGERNASGDVQKALDVFTNNTIVEAFAGTGLVAEIISEEMEIPKAVPGGAAAKFILYTDPLDGSANVDANGALGMIFAVYRRRPESPSDGLQQVRRRGSEQVAAGYVIYGPSTLLVYTSSAGVNGFTLDPNVGDFLLSHVELRCPVRGNYLSANLAHLPHWPRNIQKYVEYLTSTDSPEGRRYSLRYTGAFVADFHRILLSGGIFFYPGDSEHPTGKLRLLYECAPLALLIEHAGGSASDGVSRILDIEAHEIHQRTPIVIGSAEEVASFEIFFKQEGAASDVCSRGIRSRTSPPLRSANLCVQ